MDVRALVNARPTGQTGQQNLSGYVSYQQPPPATFTDDIYVVIPSQGAEASFPMPWPKIHGNTLPIAGTPVLIAYDERDVPWLVTWLGVYS